MQSARAAVQSLGARAPLLTAAGLVVAGVLAWGAFNTAMEATNTLPFCISCHAMRTTVYEEYRQTAHFKNPSGVQAGCPDCHVPKDWIPKLARKIRASKELYHWAVGSISTPEKFEAKRAELAARVWESMKASDSRECRNCHTLPAMDTASQGRFAGQRHADAPAKGQTCIDCHKGLTHHLPRPAAHPAQEMAAVDVELGEDINNTCAACHGRQGQGTADGVYPRLAGLDAGYLARQIEHFKSKERLNIPMLPYATDRELPGDDVQAITTYLANLELPRKLQSLDEDAKVDALARLKEAKTVLNVPLFEGDAGRGKRLYEAECATCHGRDGYGDRARSIPQLAGQHSLYLKRQIGEFGKGVRRHEEPADAAIFQLFTDAEVNDMLAHISTLDDA